MARKKVNNPKPSKIDSVNPPKTSPTPALFFSPEGSIDRSTLNQVKELLKTSENKTIYLVIKSTGGDAYSAVRIMKHVRTKYTTIIGVVPDYAYSAATLMLLGTNKICISPEGYIGPIDKPMEHSPSGEPISALDVTQSVTNLASLVSQNAKSFYAELRGRNSSEPISKHDALEISWKTAVEFAKPIVDKIDPVLLQKAYRDLRIGMYYGIDLLGSYMLKGKKCVDIVGNLVHTYPSHGYAIFRDELRDLGLIIEDLETNKDFEVINNRYKKQGNGIIFIDDIYA